MCEEDQRCCFASRFAANTVLQATDKTVTPRSSDLDNKVDTSHFSNLSQKQMKGKQHSEVLCMFELMRLDKNDWRSTNGPLPNESLCLLRTVSVDGRPFLQEDYIGECIHFANGMLFITVGTFQSGLRCCDMGFTLPSCTNKHMSRRSRVFIEGHVYVF